VHVGGAGNAGDALAQPLGQPVVVPRVLADDLDVDRVKAGQMGLTQRDVTSSMLISLSGNNQVAPSFWLNPANGISYNVGVQTSQ